jgi:cysteine desulfurase
MPTRVYLDNAATTPVRPDVLEAMLPYLTQHFGNPSSIHQEGRVARAAVEQSRKTVAQHIGASTGEIFFTSGGTEANNTAIKGAVHHLGVRRIITSPAEHNCVRKSVECVQASHQVRVEMVKIDKYALPDMDRLESLLAADDTPTLVTLMHANNEIGSMLDLGALSAVCRKYNAWLHSDTVQTVGHFPVNVRETPVDFISGAAHKFHGPKGIGFLYINNRVRMKPLIDGGSQERNMRAGTENVAGIVGLAKALQFATDSFAEEAIQIAKVRAHMKQRLIESVPGVAFNGHPEESLYAVLNVSFPPSEHNDMLVMSLDIAGISASGGSACSSGAETQSHVLQAIGHPADRKAVRFSFSRYTTTADIDLAVSQLAAILAGEVPVMA